MTKVAWINPTTLEELEQQREKAHKEMRQNKNWLWETDNGHLICRCKNCGCGHIIPFYAYENPYNYCYHCGHSAADPCVLSADGIKEGSGSGIIENWLPPCDGEEESIELIPCAYCYGHIVDNTGAVWKSDGDMYGKKYGYRVWTVKPTDEQREAVKWND